MCIRDRNDTVVEIGCGRGALTDLIIEKVVKFYGIDLDENLFMNLREKYQSENVEIINKNSVKFNFLSSTNRELPLIIGQMQILPKHFWYDKKFTSSGLIIPIGSGPYKIEKLDPGKMILYKRVENHWAENFPVNKGYYNFDSIQYDYYRDAYVMIEALKAKQYDFRHENISKESSDNILDIVDEIVNKLTEQL